MNKLLYLFKGCGKCGGDLTLNVDEWSCFQCGHIYYPQPSPIERQLDRLDFQDPSANGEADPDRKRPKVRRSARHQDPLVSATRFNEKMWWTKNQHVIYHLDQGKKVREIAEIVGQGPRQIRGVRERLHDLRSVEPELVGVH